MSKKNRSFSLIAAATVFTAVVGLAFAGNFGGLSFFELVGSQAKASGNSQTVSSPLTMTIGMCDTAGPIEIESSGGTMTPTAYATLKAGFDAINAGTHTGSINIEVCGNTTEAATASLDASGSGSASYTDVTVRPVGGARIIDGSIIGAIVKLNGADNVTIDGRQGGTGTARDLTVRNNSNSTGAAAVWLSSVATDAGATNNVVRNLELACGATNANTNSTFGIIMSGTTISTTSNGADNDNNQFIFNRITSARYGIVTRGVTTNNNISPIITDNIIGPNAFGPDGISKVGILLQADTGALVSRNTVQFIGGDLANTTSGADRVGIAVGTDSWSATSSTTITSGDYTVTRNSIHDVVEERTFSSVGIILGTTRSGSPTNNLVANNFIYNLRANGTTGDQLAGIGISGGNADKVVFNSISLTGDMDPGAAAATTTYGSAIRIPGANAANNANFVVANNSIYLDASSSSTAANRYYAITLNGAAYSFGTGFLNNNNYFINGANPQVQTGGLGTNTGNSITTQFAALVDWQAALTAPQDANSIQADPQYVSNTSDLHIAMASPNVNAGVAAGGVTTDFDGQLRVAVPDIGADEPDGLTPPMNDMSATALVTPANGSTRGTGVAFTPQASFTNIGTNAQTSVTVRFKILDGMMAEVYNQTASIPSINPGASTTVDFPSATINTTGSYVTVASVELAGDENGANDSVSGSVSFLPPFSGSYDVGSAESFTSLTNSGGIFDSINSLGATGNIVINVTSDLTAETGSVALNELPAGITVTIRPSGAPRTISGSSTTAIIKINDADDVTIDGSLAGGVSNAVGGNAAIRNLTIQNTSTTATAGATIAVFQGVNGAQNFTIKNVNVSGQDPIQTLVALHIGGNSVGTSPTVSNNNSRVENCSLQKAILGIFTNGVSPATPATGTVITQNDLSATGANRLRRAGIFFFNQSGIQITENTIGGIDTNESADAIGIIAGIQNVTNTTTTGGGVFNANISRNKISGVVSSSTVGFSAAGIAIAGDPAGSNTVANNMISGVTAPTTSPDLVAGVFVAGVPGSNTKLYYNSVAMTGDRGAVASQVASFGLAYTADVALELKNNIFYTTQTSGGGANAKSYAIGTVATTFANLDSNYNDFWSTGANDGGFRSGSLGGGAGTDYADLAAWQAAVSDDANSQEADPLFVSDLNDLHLQGMTPVDNDGTPVMGITNDFDGNLRSLMAPEIGADELFVAVPGSLEFSSATYSGGETDATVTLTVSRVGGTDGAVSADYSLSGVTATGGASCGAGIDFVNTGGTVNFANGESSKTFDVALCDDLVYEGNETFTSTLSNATGGATIGMISSATVTIADNETQPTVQFSSATYSTTEPLSGSLGMTGATITVTLTGPSQSSVGVDYATSDGTATGGAGCTTGVDYISTSGTATFSPGDVSKTFFVPVCLDTTVEGDETVNLALSNPSGATLGTPDAAVLTITDNDVPTGPVTVTATGGTNSASYNNLTEAVAAINAGTHLGDIVVNVNQSVVEPASVVLNGSGAGAASYTSVLIRPSADGLSVSGPTVQGRGLIELNGADNVTIDGDNPNTAGVNRNLTLQNTAANTVTFTSVVRIALAISGVNSADGNTVKNLNILGSATGRNISTATGTTASENTTFGIFAGPGGSTTDQTAAPAAVTSVSTSVAAGATATNLVVSNNGITTAARAISMNGSATTVFPGLQIKQNAIGNPTAGEADQVYSIGITAQGSTNAVISDNTVWIEGYVASSAATHGINVGVNSVNVTGATIERNKINRVQSNNGQTWSAFGINLGGGSGHTVQNNFVSGVLNSQVAGTGGFGTTFGAYGIRISSGTGHKVYHNSVHLYGALPGVTSTDLTSGFLLTSTALTGIDVRNNIFANEITGGNPTGTRNVAVYLPSGATSALNLTWNNNAYYVGTDAVNRLAQVGTTFGSGEYLAPNFDPTQNTPATNFRAYTSLLSAAGTNDDASFASTSSAPFTSNSDLHIPAATATRLESGGAAVGVGSDIDLEMRNGSTPDIGGDEFAGLPAAPNDIAAVAFVSPANGSNVPVGQTFGPQASFNNNGTAAQTNVTVRYTIIDGSMMTVYNQTAVIPSISPLQTIIVTFPSTSLASPGAYAIAASAELAGDQNTGNDTISGSLTGVPPVTGTINVGAGETFTSLTNPGGVFQTLNTNGISGNITVNITSDLTAETGAIALNQLSEVGAGGYSVTFKPSGAARTISGTSAASSALIILSGADRIVFDGSLSGGTDRSLTITNNQATTGIVLWMRSPSAANGATNNTVKNCILNGAPGPNSTTVAGILTGSGTTLGADAEAPNSNNTIRNNWIYRVQNSLYLRGGATAPVFDQNWVVADNELGSTAVNDNNIFRGMLIGNAQNFAITGNTVHGIRSTTTTTAAMSGIQIGLLVNGGTVARNKISNIKNVSATGTGAYGVSVIATSAASNVTIANNFISDVAANGSATVNSNGFGMAFTGSGSGYNVYFNSVNMNTDQTTAQTSAAMLVNSTFATAGALDVRNNIFANTQTTGARYAVYSTAAASVFTAIDYNDYFAPSVGFIGGSARTTLGDWQTATGQDANSKAVDPLFVSTSDLHLQAGSPMLSSAVSGTGITTDIDGETRQTPPDIGADEIVTVAGTLQFSNPTYSGDENTGPFTITVTRTGGSDGSVTVDYATSNGTATGGAACTAGVDYITDSGTLTFLNGETSKTFDVAICDDTNDEPDETINYTLTNPTGGATLGMPSSAVQTIVDNDPPAPTFAFSVSDVRVREGNTGTAFAVFNVTMSSTMTISRTGPGPLASVQYATANGTATDGTDYFGSSGTLNFNSTGTLTVSVPVNGDTNKEANETFTVNLSNPSPNSAITDARGVGIIIDEDRAYVGDYDRDLRTDYGIFRPSEGTWYVLQSALVTPKIVPLGSNGDVAVPGDYDADGLADFAVWRPSEGNWYVLPSSTSVLAITHWGTSGDTPVQGDYDGDGKTDLAIFRPSTGTWWTIQSSTSSSTAIQFGISTDRPVQGDYDGDAKTDIAVYRDGVWYILKSSDSSLKVGNWGTATDKPVSGDFDGDGSYDLAIYRNGDWWILSSLSGTTRVVNFGNATDVPAPADFDGDGTTDIVIFRPSTGDWHVLKSSDQSITGVNWGVAGDVPIPSAYIP